MDALVGWILDTVGIGVVVPTVLWLVFRHADHEVNPCFRAKVADFLLVSPPTSLWNMGEIFVGVFDATFGTRVWGRKFIMRSIFASVISVVAMTMIWLIVNFDQIHISSGIPGLHGPLGDKTGIRLVFTVFVVSLMFAAALVPYNMIPDYFSLVQTRFILGKMVGKRGSLVVLYLFVDLVLTTFIAMAMLGGFCILLSGFLEGTFRTRFWELLSSGLSLDFTTGRHGFGGIFGIFFYSTYFSSVWIWTYSVTMAMMRATLVVRPLRDVLPVRKRPFLSVGNVVFGPVILISIILRQIIN